MSENKTGKYFKYAIGEIILVVIGILIALQVSNWNQERLNSIQELNALDNLKTELQTNIEDLQR
jgi:sensor domain CHASE-containing protein